MAESTLVLRYSANLEVLIQSRVHSVNQGAAVAAVKWKEPLLVNGEGLNLLVSWERFLAQDLLQGERLRALAVCLGHEIVIWERLALEYGIFGRDPS